jgi:hypothetical protein
VDDVNNYIISCSTTGNIIGMFTAFSEREAADWLARADGFDDLAHEAATDRTTVDALLSEIEIEQLDLDATVAALATQMVATDLECGDTSAWGVISVRNAAYHAGISSSVATAVATHCYGLLVREYHATMVAGRRAA